MTEERLHRMRRLARALKVRAQFEQSGDSESIEEFLDGNADIRELLEPMLRRSAEPRHEPTGRVVGDYRILREVGRGGMGVVYEAEQLSLARRVALKVLPPHVTLDEHSVARFHREAEVAAQLDHPGIVRVIEAGHDGDTHYLAMQFVDGVPLNQVVTSARSTGIDRLGSTTLATVIRAAETAPEAVTETTTTSNTGAEWSKAYVEAIVSLTAQVADALHYAHEAGVIHRDVKPANILVRPNGGAVVTDFGIARREDLPSMTRTGDFAGTPYYVSPEQAMAKRVAIDHRTDVFSLGVTLYELSTLKRPFDGETTQEVLARIVGKEPRDPCRANPDLAPDLGAVILKAIEKDPDRRYQSAHEFAEDLRAFVAYRPVEARRNSWHVRLSKWVRREPWKAAALGTLMLALVAVATVTGVFVNELIVSERRASTEWSRAEKALADFRLLSMAVELKDIERDADRLAPPWPEQIEAMRAWLGQRARPLAARLPALNDELKRLRASALPYTEEDERHDRESHPRFEELQITRSVIEEYEHELATTDESTAPRPRAEAEELLATARQSLEPLEREVGKRWTYRFGDDAVRFLHERLIQLVTDLEAFSGKTGAVRRIERQLEWAENVRDRSLVEPADRWRDAIDAIRRSDGVTASTGYRYLELEPQIGLVPLGMDPESKLWEFVHLASGVSGHEAPERDPETGWLRVTDDSGIVFVLVPGGTFTMGAQAEDSTAPHYDAIALPQEAPPHGMTLAPYFLAKHELTQGQFWRLARENIPAYYNATSHRTIGYEKYGFTSPVERLSWMRARDLFTRWGLDLPTEAQWEFACRAGSHGPWHSGGAATSLEGFANIAERAAARFTNWPTADLFDDGRVNHAPVGSYAPNSFGLHDMHGNVGEWVRDGNTTYRNRAGSGDGYRITGPPYLRGIRGGNFRSLPDQARTTNRYAAHREYVMSDTGCRAARAIRRGDH